MQIDEFRNAAYTVDGRINLEIRHPVFGWIPFTLDENDDAAEIDVAALWASVTAGSVAAYVTPPVDPQRVNDERDRRIEVGKTFTVAAHTIAVTGRDEDKTNLQALAMAAQLMIAGGDMTTTTPFRDETNTIFQLTPPELLNLWQQATAYVSAVYAASWVLKDGAEIPQDFTDDGYWP